MDQGKRVYITISPDAREKFTGLGYSGQPALFDFSIPLPVELLPGETSFKPESLTPEMILSGILRELADNPKAKHSGYYRSLAAALRPGLLAELTGAAALKAKNGDYEAAMEIIAILEGLFPGHPVVLLNKAQIIEARTETETEGAAPEAETAWEDALAASGPDSNPAPLPDILFYSGLFYYKQGDYRRAAELFDLYLEPRPALEDGLSPEDAQTEEDKHITARELIGEIRKDGLDDEVLGEACSLLRSGKEEQGIVRARDFLERRPLAARGWFVLGWGLRRLGRWKDGAACFDKALELGLSNADTRNEFAICLIETGNLDKAKAELESALREEPENVKIISNLGVLALKRGKKEEAAAFFRAALEINPSDPLALACLKTA